MLHFGRDVGRRSVQSEGFGDRLSLDPALMQLLPLAALRAEAASSGLAAHSVDKDQQARAFLRHSAVLQEIARRTGEVETLGRAASAALRARDLAKDDRRLMAEALLAHAGVLSLGAGQFGDAEAAAGVGERLDKASTLPLDALGQAQLAARRATLLAQTALSAERPDPEAAAKALAAAAVGLNAFASRHKIDDSETHALLCDRAELLIGVGQQGKDPGLLEAALATLDALAPLLDVAYRPLTWARAETLRGQALTVLGDLTGDTGAFTGAVAALTQVVDETPVEHSPLDAARAAHALGLALQALGEASDDDALFDRALAAFTIALETVDTAPLLPFRSIVAHDSAACLARRAERRGDLVALERAEGAFRNALKLGSAEADPLSWAVTQLALARIYEAEAEIRGDTGERADAAFALASALDVFAERGLRSLSDMALTALERVKATA